MFGGRKPSSKFTLKTKWYHRCGCCNDFKNAWRSLFIDISSINSSFKNLPSHFLKVELLLFGDSKLSAINNNLILNLIYSIFPPASLCKIFFICFFSCLIVINYIAEKKVVNNWRSVLQINILKNVRLWTQITFRYRKSMLALQ